MAPTEASASRSAPSASSKGSVRLRPATPSHSVRSSNVIGADRRVLAVGAVGRQRDLRRAQQRPGGAEDGRPRLLRAHRPVHVEGRLEQAEQAGPVVQGVELAGGEVAHDQKRQHGHRKVHRITVQEEGRRNGDADTTQGDEQLALQAPKDGPTPWRAQCRHDGHHRDRVHHEVTHGGHQRGPDVDVAQMDLGCAAQQREEECRRRQLTPAT